MFWMKNSENPSNDNQRKSGNPTLSYNTFIWLENIGNETMTLDWTVNKSLLLVLITIISAWFIWSKSEMFLPFILPIIVINLIISIVIVFSKKTSPYLTPVYALLEWVLIWVISSFVELRFPWIIFQAVWLTFGVFLSLLLAYKSGLIRATENFKLWIISATFWIFLVYMVSLIWVATWLYNIGFIHDSWPYWILFSLFVVGIAAFNFVLDFDFIEEWVKQNAPKYMEWYWAFSLLVTLIWLYFEILKLLAKLRSND